MKRKSDGIILITVLWVLVILSLLSLSLAHQAKIEVKLASHYRKEAQLRQLAKAAVRAAVTELASDTNDYDAMNETWRKGPSQLGDCLYDIIGKYPQQGIGIEYAIVDGESKLNINEVSNWILLELPEVDEEIADSIIDWRDENDYPLTYGAEDAYYQSLENPYPCKNAPFDLADELLLVRGITDEIFYGGGEENAPALKDLLTVWGDGKINVNTAREEILLTVPGVREEIMESIIERRAGPDGDEGTEDDEPFESMESLKDVHGITAAEYEKLKSYCKVASSHFIIEARALSKKSNFCKKVTTVLKREGNSFMVLMWKEN
jgi:general secretion pathway protein K